MNPTLNGRCKLVKLDDVNKRYMTWKRLDGFIHDLYAIGLMMFGVVLLEAGIESFRDAVFGARVCIFIIRPIKHYAINAFIFLFQSQTETGEPFPIELRFERGEKSGFLISSGNRYDYNGSMPNSTAHSSDFGGCRPAISFELQKWKNKCLQSNSGIAPLHKGKSCRWIHGHSEGISLRL
jgi:hypothetical protein